MAVRRAFLMAARWDYFMAADTRAGQEDTYRGFRTDFDGARQLRVILGPR